MQIAFSDFLSTIAILISIGSAYYAKKQSEYARFSSSNDYRAHLSDNHKKYQEVLQEIKKRHEKDLSDLKRSAGETLSQIVRVIDEYDIAREGRPLRHLVDEAGEMAYFTVKGQFGWQTGLNISHRFYIFRRVEELLNPSMNISGNEYYREKIRKLYFSNKNTYLESAILKDYYFSDLVRRAKSRIDPKRTAELLIRVQKIFQSFSDQYSELKSRVLHTSEELEGILRDGEKEHFSLTESPHIYEAMRHARATFDVLGHLTIPDIKEEHAHHLDNYTSHCIYTCALLYAIQGIPCWGWREIW